MTRMKSFLRAIGFGRFLALASILLFAFSVYAQLPTGTILGTVKDPSGAVIAGATVTVTNADTGFTRNVMTEADGSYRFDALPVGNYSIKVTHEGFQTEQRTGLALQVAQFATIDIVMQVGSTSQTVTVTEAVPLVDTTSSSVGGTVDEQRVADLPLNGRNWTDLTLLQTGVTKINIFTGNAGSVNLNGTFYSSDGATIRSNMYLLDGADMRTAQGLNNTSITNTSLGVDGIKEYKVVSILPDASYPLVMGAQTTIVSKGGTNEWHGDVFEYLRNASLDARNYFDALDVDNAQGFGTDKSPVYPDKRIPPFRRNNFGASGGGPIKKDKLFFYAVYEGIRQGLGVTLTKTTMPKACFVDQNNVLQPVIPAQINDNGTKAPIGGTPPNPYGTCVSGGTAPYSGFGYNPNNAIFTLNPVIQPLADLWPQPNVTEPTFNYTFPYIQPTAENYGQIRTDYNLSGSDTAFFRYTQDDADQTSNYSYPGLNIILHSASQIGTISETHIFTPTMLNTFRFSVSRQVATLFNGPQPSAFLQSNILLVASPLQQAEKLFSVTFGSQSPGSPVTGMMSDPGPQYVNADFFTWSDDVYWTKGKHSFKFGMLANYIQDFTSTFLFGAGSLSFPNLNSYFNGVYSAYSVSPLNDQPDRQFHSNTWGWYAQDDYRVSNRLTLNLGLRYEFTTVPTEANPALRYQFRNPVTDTQPTPGPLFNNPSLLSFSPRLGFAWDVFGNGKTSLRGGAGMYHDIGNFGGLMVNNSIDGPPISGTDMIQNTLTTPATRLTIPFNVPTTGLAILSPRTVSFNPGEPSLIQRALTLDQQLPWNMGLTVSYVGSQGWDIWIVREGNNTIPAGVNAGGVPYYACFQSTPNATNPNPSSALAGANGACQYGAFNKKVNTAIGQTQLDLTGGNTYYNSLQVQLNKRISQGLQFQFNYTWSHLEDEGQSASQSETGTEVWQVPNGYNNLSDRGPSVYDATHNVRVNLIYHAPTIQSNGFVSKFANGWWFSTIVSGQTGYPITPLLGSDRALQNDFQESERPNLDPSFNRGSAIVGKVSEWFNPTMYDLPAAGTLGTAGRGILRGPGYQNVDFSIVKDTKAAFLGEAGNIEFRAEMFNLFNHTNFGLPATTIWTSGTPATVPSGQIGSAAIPAVSNAGQITSTVNNSRQIQFALKLIF